MVFANRRPRWRALPWLLLPALVAAGCVPFGRVRDDPPGANAHLLIAEVYPNGQAGDGSDQFLRLYNPTDSAVALGGWSVGDAKVRATFPTGAQIGPRQSLFVARDTAGFRKVMSAPPEYVWAIAAGETTPVLNGGAALRFGPASGVAVLRSAGGQAVDVVAYGAPPPASVGGWRGAGVPAPGKGEVIDRARDEAGWTAAAPGGYTLDTDTAADWKQGDMWLDGRVYRPGQTFFGYPTYTVKSLVAYTAPDSAFQTVSAALDGARESIDLNMYDFTVVPLAQKLAAAARRGVKVRMLVEGGSVNGIYDQERYTAQTVAEAGGEVRWILNDPARGYVGRYVYDHAKYAVIDGRTTLMQSENFVRHGTPEDPSFGNRGWGVVVEESALAAYMARVFEADWNPAYGDLVRYTPGTPFGPPAPGFTPETGVLTGAYPHPFPPLTMREPVAVTPILAPDHTLLQAKGIIGLMRSAKQSLLIEQQYIHVYCHVSRSISTRA
jgi:cardiolipin synthase A/B